MTTNDGSRTRWLPGKTNHNGTISNAIAARKAGAARRERRHVRTPAARYVQLHARANSDARGDVLAVLGQAAQSPAIPARPAPRSTAASTMIPNGLSNISPHLSRDAPRGRTGREALREPCALHDHVQSGPFSNLAFDVFRDFLHFSLLVWLTASVHERQLRIAPRRRLVQRVLASRRVNDAEQTARCKALGRRMLSPPRQHVLRQRTRRSECSLGQLSTQGLSVWTDQPERSRRRRRGKS